MPFKGVTFSGQNVTPKNDGGLYASHHGDGILWGCLMNISGDDLVIQSGEFIAYGRVCQVDGATNVDLSGRTLQTGYIQVIMNYDLTQSEGSQWYTTFVESATTTFPALTRGNINDTDTLYQLELAVVQISGGNLTSIYSSLGTSSMTSQRYYANGVTENAQVIIQDNGTSKGILYHDRISDFVRIGSLVNGNIKTAITCASNGNIVIYGASGGYIALRPYGYNNTTNQLYLDGGDGQLWGGFPLSTVENSTTRTLSNGGTLSLGTINKPSSASYGVQFGYVKITPNAQGFMSVALNGSQTTCYVPNGVSVGITICGVFAGTSAFSISPLTSFGGSVTYSRLDTIWFA